MERNGDRALRLASIFAWIPAFALLLPHRINTGRVLPVLGIAPITFSAVTGIFHVAGRAKSRTAYRLMDLFCASFLISVLIPSFVALAEYNNYGRWCMAGIIMLGSYGTVPLMMSLYVLVQTTRALLVSLTIIKHYTHMVRGQGCHASALRPQNVSALPW